MSKKQESAKGIKTEDGKWKCKKCGEVFGRHGNLNFHWQREHEENAAPGGSQSSGSACEHTWRPLRDTDPREKQAKSAGWGYVCTECQVLGVRRDGKIRTEGE